MNSVTTRHLLNWFIVPLAGLLGLVAAFAIFRPVKVVPRIAAGPEYRLEDQQGQPFTQEEAGGRLALYGFGYSADPTPAFQQTLADMRAFEHAVSAQVPDLILVLILFDDRRDTADRRAALAEAEGLDPTHWVLLGGDAENLKRTIGQGFGVYYEAVPLADLDIERQPKLTADAQDYGYLQAQRYILVDGNNIIRAEYRAPLDIERTQRDIRLIVREANSTGVARTLNEAAHLFMCYPE